MHGDRTKLRRSLELPERIATPAKLAMSAAVLCGMMLLTAVRPSSVADATAPPSAASEKPQPSTLHEAATAGDLAELQRLLHFRPINERDGIGRTALYYAVESGRVEVVKFLTARGANTFVSDEHGFFPVHIVPNRDVLLALHPVRSPSARSLIGWTQLHTAADVEIAAIELDRHRNHLEWRDERHRTAVDMAVLRGNVDLVRFYIKWTADITPIDGERVPPLVLAAGRGDVELVDILLAAGASPSAHAKWGETPLSAAALSGSAACVRRLLSAGADARLPNGDGQSVLCQAVIGGDLECVRLLIAAGAPVQPAGAENRDVPLIQAVCDGRADIAQTLIDAGANVENSVKNDRAMHLAVGQPDPAVVEALLKAGADPMGGEPRNETLRIAVLRGFAGNVRLLLEAGVDPNFGDPRNDQHAKTALPLAARNGSLEIVEALLAAKVDPNQGRALAVAVAENHTAIALALVDAGADPNSLDRDRNDPVLWDAVRKGNVAVARALCEAGAKLRSSDGETPLLYAVLSGNTELVRLLLAHGDQPDQPGRDAALGTAVERNDVEVVRALLEAKANPNAESEYGPFRPLYAVKSPEVLEMLLAAGAELRPSDYTPLHAAQTPQMIDDFIARGIDVNEPDDQCRTPLFHAAINGRAEVVRRLLELGADPRIAAAEGRLPRDYAKDPAVLRVFEEFAARSSR